MKNSMNKIINFLTLTCAMLSVCAMQSMQLEKKGTHARAMTAGETPSGSSIAMDIDSSADAKSVSSHAHASDSDVVLAVEKTQIMPIPPGIFRTDGMDYYPIKIARTHDGKRGVVLGKSTDDLYCFATYKAIDGKWQPDEYLGIKNEDEKTSLGWLDSEPLMTLSRDGRFIAFGFSKNEKIGIFDLEGKCDKVIVLPRAKKDCPWYEHNDPQATFLPKGKRIILLKLFVLMQMHQSSL